MGSHPAGGASHPQSAPSLPFVAAGPDRAARLRTPGAAEAARGDPTTRVIAVGAGQSVLRDGESRLARLALDVVPDDAELTLLGLDLGGGVLFAYDAAQAALGASGFVSLREAAVGLDASEAALAAYAVAIVGWHRSHRYCGRCGALTAVEEAGHVRHCPGCGAHLFPRTDPAVIMLVVSGGRCVLSRRVGAPERRWSALAGFVEPGETPEAAVVREAAEEVGLRVADVRYEGAQPWPFPSSLMLGFRAELALGASDLLEVERSELVDARWFPRAELREAVREGHVELPDGLSLGHRLIRRFIDEG